MGGRGASRGSSGENDPMTETLLHICSHDDWSRAQEAGALRPASLDEIPKDILPAVPLDPFDNRPLRLETTPDGIGVAASRGPRVKDDRIAFRLWNPDQRNLPPKPDPKDDKGPRT